MAGSRLVAARAVLVALAVTVAACGGGSDEKKPPDPCALLTNAEVDDALGGASQPPKRNARPSGGVVQVCTWFPARARGQRRFVQVSVAGFPGGARAVFDGGKRAAPGAKDASGIGDAAYSSELAGHTRITSLKGETVISVTSMDAPSATKLAKAALGRL